MRISDWSSDVCSSDLAFLNGTGIFLCPAGREQEACHVDICPPPHARNWKVYTSLAEAAGHPRGARRHGFGMYAAPNYGALIDHPIEMGTQIGRASCRERVCQYV